MSRYIFGGYNRKGVAASIQDVEAEMTAETTRDLSKDSPGSSDQWTQLSEPAGQRSRGDPLVESFPVVSTSDSQENCPDQAQIP